MIATKEQISAAFAALDTPTKEEEELGKEVIGCPEFMPYLVDVATGSGLANLASAIACAVVIGARLGASVAAPHPSGTVVN